MACPYFYPLERVESVPQPARAPLGAFFGGRCEIGGEAGGDACNFGYAAGRCEFFPANAEADAVRFSAMAGKTIFILEKDCSPVRFGDVASLDGTLARQAEVFNAWLNR